MTPEQSYGLALRAYPRWWRDQRQSEVLGVLLDAAADRGSTRPSAREVLDLLMNGVATRFRSVPEPGSKGLRNLTARLALSSLTVLSTLTVAFGEVWPWKRPGILSLDRSAEAAGGTLGAFFTAGGPVLALTVVLSVIGLLGGTRVLRTGLPVCAGLLAASCVAAQLSGLNRPAVWAVLGVAALAGLTLVGDSTPSARWVLLTAFVTAGGATELWIRTSFAADPRPFFYYQRLGDLRPALAVGLLLGAVVVAAASRRTLAVLPVAAAWFMILGLQQQSSFQERGALAFLSLMAACLLTALVIQASQVSQAALRAARGPASGTYPVAASADQAPRRSRNGRRFPSSQ